MLTHDERQQVYEAALSAYAESTSASNSVEERMLLAEYQMLMRVYVSMSVAD